MLIDTEKTPCIVIDPEKFAANIADYRLHGDWKSLMDRSSRAVEGILEGLLVYVQEAAWFNAHPDGQGSINTMPRSLANYVAWRGRDFGPRRKWNIVLQAQ